MKKLLAFILCLITSLSLTSECIANFESVSGLDDKICKLFMKNNLTEAEITEINQKYIEYYTDYFWRERLPWLKATNKMNTDSDEEELAFYLNSVSLNYDLAVFVTQLKGERYALQYSNETKLRYLLSSQKYWAIPYVEDPIVDTNTVWFSESGGFLNPSIPAPVFDVETEALNFLKNIEQIKSLLLEKDVQNISDAKIFTIANILSFLYLQSGEQEYLVPLGGVQNPSYLHLMLYQLYLVQDVAELISLNSSDYPFLNLSERLAATKPTYESEAEALHQQGLLNGNENGLDLLKPLTRIEAAAMLLRALGESETADSGSGQIFSDVPQDHWGYGAAENAYNLGLIQGVGNDQFAPDKNVTATEFSTMVLRASGTPEFDWEQALNLLIEQNIITQDNANTMDFFTRGDMAKIIYEAKAKDLL